MRFAVRRVAIAALALACVASPARAQIEDQISAYTGANAEGYLQPLADAFGGCLNSGIFRSAHIAFMHPSVRLEITAMGVFFGDDDRTFRATTEQGFSPEQRVSAPTIVGSGKAVIVEGDGGTRFAFPGGFDLNSFALAVPQLRIGGVYGSEVIFRYFSLQLGDEDEDLGDLGLFGFGFRHNISRYFGPALPVDVAAGFFWQRFSLGENDRGDHLISSTAFSIGVQASRRFAKVIVPYTGLTYDTHSMELSYDYEENDSTETIDVDFEKTSTVHLTLGLLIDVPVMNIFGEINVASQSSVAFGVGFGF